jgi:heme exporter protein D
MDVVLALLVLVLLGYQIDNRRILLRILHRESERERQQGS